MKLVNSYTGEIIQEWDSGYGGDYDLDVNPADLPDNYTITLSESVDVAVAKENKMVQSSEASKSNTFRGKEKNVTPLETLVYAYRKTLPPEPEPEAEPEAEPLPESEPVAVTEDGNGTKPV